MLIRRIRTVLFRKDAPLPFSAIFERSHVFRAFENPGKICGVSETGGSGNLFYGTVGEAQQRFSVGNSFGCNIIANGYAINTFIFSG